MTAKLTIADGIVLPDEVVTETIGIVGQKGAGKTYTAKVLTEEMYRAGLPVCVLDPLGVWHGLRSSADGDDEGYPFVVLGGDHADAPIEPTSGEVIADFVIDEAAWTVIDLSHFRKAEMRRFVTAFLSKLYHANRAPLHLMCDEADLFAPQRPGKDETALLGAMEDIVRRGRARGVGITMITQRPAVIHKDVLTQIGTLICHRITGPQDRNAVDDWVRAHGSKEQRDEMMAGLASLPTGTAWVWSPQWLDLFAQAQIRTAYTFDSSVTPGRGKTRLEPRTRADVDLSSLADRIADTIERAKANDPKELRARIAKLERDLAAAQKDAPVETVTETVEVEVVRDVVPPALLDWMEAWVDAEKGRAESLGVEVGALVAKCRGDNARPVERRTAAAPVRAPQPPRPSAPARKARNLPSAPSDDADDTSPPGKGEIAILKAVAQHMET